MIISFLTLLFFANTSWAASCCGGSFAAPSLILGDEKAQLTTSYSASTVTDDVLSNGRWLRREDENLTQVLRLEAAAIVSDSWQVGASLPFLMKSAERRDSHNGLGDISMNVAHETFPEKSFHPWKPRGVTFLSLTLPTSPSIYDNHSNPTQIRGRGFYSLSAGAALVKSWKVWDLNFTSEVHKSFARTIHDEQLNDDIEIHPNWGTTQTLGVGWNKGDLRWGMAWTYLFEDAIKSSGATNATGSFQQNISWLISGSYMLNMQSALSASISDQSLWGTPNNSSLVRSFNISYQHRWMR